MTPVLVDQRRQRWLDDGRDVRAIRVHQGDQVANQRRLGEVLELVEGVAAGVAAEPPQPVGGLIPLLQHDQQI